MIVFPKQPKEIIIDLPRTHPKQAIFFEWDALYPQAQALVAPAGTKSGKSFGSSLWLVKEALSYPRLYCVWIAPTYLKARIGYRYIKAMLPDCEFIMASDHKLEIRFSNGSFIKFLHGQDAEITVEGEAVDRFVIDEAGKTSKQVWFSLFTTITQTKGYGIITGTPRGFSWYYDVFRQAKNGDPFFCWAHLQTKDSPFVTEQAIQQAKRLLPKHLFDQYFNAVFVSNGSVFGDLSKIWDETLILPDGPVRFWIHPDETTRGIEVVHGVDLAKYRDYTVFYSVNFTGQLVGYCRFKQVPYPRQVDRFKLYLQKYFPVADNLVRFDATGVGSAVADLFVEADIDASITPVTFTNKSKSEMVTRTTMAIEQDWHKAPRIEQIEHEYSSYEVNRTKSGLFTYSAPDGDHDDVVSAAMLAISAAYQSSMAEEAEKVLEKAMSGTIDEQDSLSEYMDSLEVDETEKLEEDTDFFEGETDEGDLEIEGELM